MKCPFCNDRRSLHIIARGLDTRYAPVFYPKTYEVVCLGCRTSSGRYKTPAEAINRFGSYGILRIPLSLDRRRPHLDLSPLEVSRLVADNFYLAALPVTSKGRALIEQEKTIVESRGLQEEEGIYSFFGSEFERLPIGNQEVEFFDVNQSRIQDIPVGTSIGISPLGNVGKLVYVRETWADHECGNENCSHVVYANFVTEGRSSTILSRCACGKSVPYGETYWKPARSMPYDYSRLMLTVKGVKATRLSDLTETEARMMRFADAQDAANHFANKYRIPAAVDPLIWLVELAPAWTPDIAF